MIIRPSPEKNRNESISFLERIQGDICGPIHPPCGSFRYFMVLIIASTRWSHICLLSTRNKAFAKLLAQLIKLTAHFPDYPIKKILLIMLVNLHLMLLMIIVYQLELKLNI